MSSNRRKRNSSSRAHLGANKVGFAKRVLAALVLVGADDAEHLEDVASSLPERRVFL